MSAKVEINSKTLGSKAVILDIEGTTTSISFVKDVLFPYVKENVETFLKDNFSQDDVKAVVAQLREQAIEDVKSEVDGAVAIADETAEEAEQITTIVKNVEWQMSNDRKTASLKTLQGLIYPKGYKDGKLKAQVYEDAAKAMEQWVKSGHKIYIYSSGSVDAQKLLFAHTEHGDLSAHITNYFDTAVGAKQESKSYAAIAKEIDFAPEEIVFLTDVVKEAEAAKEAGFNVVLVSRPGNAKLTDEEKSQYAVVESFENIPLEAVGGVKRKIEEVTSEQQEDAPKKVAKTEEEKTPAVEAKEVVDAPEKVEVDSTEKETPVAEEKVIESKTAEEPMNVDVVEATTAKETPAAPEAMTPVVETETKKTEETEVATEETTEKKNGHTNGNANGHVENGTTNGTTDEEKTEEKTVEKVEAAATKAEESPEEIKAKKLAEAEPEVAPPVETAEA